MSDTRFTLIGIGLIFAGFIVLGVLGQHHYNLAIQSQQFGECFEYKDGTQIPVDCNVAMQDRNWFFALVIALIGGGIFFLVKGVRGKWDQDVKEKDKVGPDRSFPS
ncbi:hypothetical protein [Candidatus Nitrosotenuis uzonensis]|uniref:Transmembrane protein n=1 Tax=Candidatus Nitrosotenuis uzonensis TaxID=1407055 RepID=A0A812F5Y8_9ARCH|nr:hypothetical protein [Candidatus Nitrosotenuis uzonensis]CAE6500754.1 conserved hypothetical protein [Candidatus Nitrosotenuis uzonensis]